MQAEAEYLPLSDASLTGMLMLDVLEHVDDVLLLRDAHRALRPGGWVVATVPAMPWLWSYRDVAPGISAATPATRFPPPCCRPVFASAA